jgi:non-ribosomal peptide synthetase component E (peptide arylation enzyme)
MLRLDRFAPLVLALVAPASLPAQTAADSGTFVVRHAADTGAGKSKVLQRARVIFKEDSVAVDEVSDAGLMTRIFGTERGAMPYLNLSFALLEQAVRRSRTMPATDKIAFFNLGGGQTKSAKISPLGTDSLNLDLGDVEFHLRVDAAGRVLGGRIPKQNVVVERR